MFPLAFLTGRRIYWAHTSAADESAETCAINPLIDRPHPLGKYRVFRIRARTIPSDSCLCASKTAGRFLTWRSSGNVLHNEHRGLRAWELWDRPGSVRIIATSFTIASLTAKETSRNRDNVYL